MYYLDPCNEFRGIVKKKLPGIVMSRLQQYKPDDENNIFNYILKAEKY